ncbi:MAG: Hsp70 family protein, partial [Prevotella sp.]|nr:Hsp70 family protein [Prevotella sp.]
MARIKIDYGIDLGTTNSAISRMEKGKAVVIRTDCQKEIMPSCVSFTKRKIVKVGDLAYNDLKNDKLRASKSLQKWPSNAYVEFKRGMGTNARYFSSNMGKDFSSEELSAEVLKALKSFVLDENFSSVVVTVPAKFTVNQKTATLEAAKLAGFKRCELLQEPIAAAMAYGLNSDNKNGRWMVFDFGGGTFDAALLAVEDGIIQVLDTEGDNYLGGKDLDYAIVDNII